MRFERAIHLISKIVVSAAVLTAIACSGSTDGSSTGPKQTPAVVTSLSFVSGTGQTARRGTQVPVVPIVVAKDQRGSPMPGVAISFSTSGGGSVGAASAITDANGSASPASWTLSSTAGTNVITATAAGGINPSTQITATARNPLWTVMVYMAADNNLALSGIDNIDQIESGGSNPEVQVVVQAEFSPTTLARVGCGSFCFNRPNFNTFRYIVTPGANVRGPNGPVTDIGNRNMVDPAQLNEFLSFAKQTVPAEHYVVVMWNHGNGYSGLLVDETSAPGAMMSLNQFATALNGVGSLDIIAFDMCLMGGYETLTKIAGTASYAVFSESVVPGAGYPYDEIMRAFNSDPGMSSRNAAIMVADKFDASYAGQRPSTTVSAYDLAGFASFEASLNNLAGSLKVNLPSLSSAIASSASHSQAFEVRPIKDLGNLLDSLSARISDGGIATNINAVRAAAGAFRLQHHARNGSDPYASNVSRASGLSIVLPSGVASDRLPASGSGSLGDYRATLGTKPWAEFLTAWAGSQAPLGYTDMGTQRFETYLVWDSAAVNRAADIDMFVLEPDGYLYGPALGSISPSGLFTADSRNTHLYLEGFGMGRYVQTGSYRFYAFLWTDPANYGPAYTVYYRNSPSAEFQSLYSAPYPRLTRGNSILSDPFASFSRIDNGQYTDFRPIAMLTIPPAFASSQLNLDLKAESPGNSVASESFGGVTTNIERLREPTSAQLETLKSLIRKRREGVMKGRLELPSLRNIRPPAEKQD